MRHKTITDIWWHVSISKQGKRAQVNYITERDKEGVALLPHYALLLNL